MLLRSSPTPGSLVITEGLHALFQSILAEQGHFAVNALTSQVTRLLTPFREPRPWLPYLHGVQEKRVGADARRVSVR
jgi:hypothetical protein